MNTRTIVEGGLCVALTLILGWITFWKMPQGGSIHAAHMVPLLLFALRRGTWAGILAGIAYGALHFLIGAKYSLQPLSILLDYLLAYGVLGLAGLAGTYPTKYKGLLVALGAMLCRMICSILSGAIVFAAYAPAGMNPWLYSISYNSSVMLPDIAINLIVLWILYQKIVRLPRT